MRRVSVFTAELVGTFLLILLGGGVCANVSLKKTGGHNSGWIVITAGWGLAVTIAVYAVVNVSGAHINPAVTLGLASIGELPWHDVPKYVAAQMLGAILGAATVWLAYLPHWEATDDPAAKLGVFSTAPAIRKPFANLLCEIIGTFALVLGVLAILSPEVMTAEQKEMQKAMGVRPESHCLSACSFFQLAFPSAAPPATPSTPRATSARALPTRCCPFTARAAQTGATRGSPSSARASAASSALGSTRCSGFETIIEHGCSRYSG